MLLALSFGVCYALILYSHGDIVRVRAGGSDVEFNASFATLPW
jgi:hypothetical protein